MTKIALFGPVVSDPNKSMHLYASQLVKRLAAHPEIQIHAYSVHGTRLPLIKDILSKDIFYPFYASKRQGDVNHVTDHSYGALVYGLDPARTIVTCHDLNPLEILGQSSWLGRKRFLWNAKGMLKAACIIAISESTRKIILKYFNYKKPIHVVYHGIDKVFAAITDKTMRDALRGQYGLKKDFIYLLHVGHSTPVKNVELLIQALSKLPECRLIKVGMLTKKQWNLAERLGVKKHIQCLQGLSINQLVEVYHIADLFVFPSLVEGFGFPVLEAMACGCPVVCSHAASLPEVGGEAVEYIDPYSEASLIETIQKVMRDPNLRARMIVKGLAQAARFSWNKTAEQVLNIYKQIAR